MMTWLILLPFSLVGALGWRTVPMDLAISSGHTGVRRIFEPSAADEDFDKASQLSTSEATHRLRHEASKNMLTNVLCDSSASTRIKGAHVVELLLGDFEIDVRLPQQLWHVQQRLSHRYVRIQGGMNQPQVQRKRRLH